MEEYKYEPASTHCSSFYRGRSPLRGHEEHELVEGFKELIALEHELELAKETLAMRPNFTLHDAFKMFDVDRMRRITDRDIRDTFHMHKIFITLEEARLILSRYDQNIDGCLHFDEFSEMFLPKDIQT